MAITFERTTDYELCGRIMRHRRIWGAISDDGSPAVQDFRPYEHEAMWYVLVKEGAEILGLFLFVPQNFICYETHTCLLPRAYGKAAKEAGRGVAEWMWANSVAHRIVTNVPETNRLALQFAIDCGMTEYGRNPRSILKGGKLIGQILLGLSRPQTIEQPQEV